MPINSFPRDLSCFLRLKNFPWYHALTRPFPFRRTRGLSHSTFSFRPYGTPETILILSLNINTHFNYKVCRMFAPLFHSSLVDSFTSNRTLTHFTLNVPSPFTQFASFCLLLVLSTSEAYVLSNILSYSNSRREWTDYTLFFLFVGLSLQSADLNYS